jgi:hypothetical protein
MMLLFVLKIVQFLRTPLNHFWCLQFLLIHASFSLTVFEDTQFYTVIVPAKAKKSHYKPEQALGVPEGRSSQISRQSAHEGGKVFNPTH